MNWWSESVAPTCQESRQKAEERQAQLTKPPGSLGRLEKIAVDFAGWQGQEKPLLDSVAIRIFAADHGVATEGVSAFPQAVTGEMIRNFAAGGAAITVLARQLGADFGVVNLGTVEPLEPLQGVENLQLAPGTANFSEQPAMSSELLELALQAGRDHSPQQAQLFIGGEMGIGNTTAATAIFCAISGVLPERMVGRGTGVDDKGLEKKVQVIAQALERHGQSMDDDPFEVLRCVGGLEIAALAGAYIACAQRGIPSLVDGFIASAAALMAMKLNPDVRDWLLFAHCSDEAGHRQALFLMDVEPLLEIGLRLGEGSGAALVLPLLQAALKLHNEMATFAEASVSNEGGADSE